MTWFLRRGNKYGAKKASYKGIIYHSKKEAGKAEELDLLKQAGEIRDFERQVKIELFGQRIKICNYYVDFKIFHNDGTIEYLEIKGFETPEWRLKWLLMDDNFGNNPLVKLTVEK